MCCSLQPAAAVTLPPPPALTSNTTPSRSIPPAPLQALEALQASAHSTLDIPETQPLAEAEEAHAREAAMLSQAVQKVLGIQHLRRLFSKAELVQQAEQAQQGPAAVTARGAGQAAEGLGEIGAEGQAADLAEGWRAGSGTGGASTTDGAVQRARRAVLAAQQDAPAGPAQLALLPPHATASAHTALEAAHHAAARLRRCRLIPLPRWLLMPSEMQRHWIRYTVVGIAAGYATVFVYRWVQGGGYYT